MQALEIKHGQLETSGTFLELQKGTYRGFSIREFIWVHICSDYWGEYPDTLVAEPLYRAIRIKNGEEFVRGYSVQECIEQIQSNLGSRREQLPF